MRQRIVEIIVGAFVVVALLCFAFLALRVSGLVFQGQGVGYAITASFDNVGGLKVRAPVNIAGVRVGQVAHIELNPSTFEAVVTLTIDSSQVHLPMDTSASIFTEGLLGSNYISLTPGVEETYLTEGAKITTTHSALILENLIGQFLFNVNKK